MTYLTRVEQRGDQLFVWTPFAPVFVTDLKDAIPKNARAWDPGDKLWRIDETYRKDLEDLLYAYFGYRPGEGAP
jgi:hypothetical protein